jgi:CheY-like chemotaxis protein
VTVARILVIDDEVEIQAILGDLLRSVGHEVLVASEGGEGTDLYRRHHPDLVITDIFMPGKHGLGVISELSREGARIIAMSGWGRDYLETAEDYGALKSLKKPFTREELMTTVAAALSR